MGLLMVYPSQVVGREHPCDSLAALELLTNERGWVDSQMCSRGALLANACPNLFRGDTNPPQGHASGAAGADRRC